MPYRAERLLVGRRDGVQSPSDDIRDQIRGFVAGYHHHLRRTGVAKLSDPACRGKAWVRPLTETDVWRTSWASMVRAGSLALLDGIVAAAPPAAGKAAKADAAPGAAAVVAARDGAGAGIGSNAYGLGARPPPPAAGWCSPTRTSPGRAPTASTACTSRCPVATTWRVRR